MDDDARRKDVAERAERIYQERIRPLVEKEHFGKELLIEVDSGDYEIARDRNDYFEASRRLRERHPGSRAFLMRIGYRAAARIGGARWRSDEASPGGLTADSKRRSNCGCVGRWARLRSRR